MIVTLLIYRDLSLAGLWKTTTQSVYLTAQVLIIVGAATLVARLLTIAEVPQTVIAWIEALKLAPWMVMLIINVLLLIVGCVLDPASAILVLAMGADHDETAVVDGQFRVRGIDRLRVVDASVMPDIVDGNINAPIIMIAEKAADAIRGRPPLSPATV